MRKNILAVLALLLVTSVSFAAPANSGNTGVSAGSQSASLAGAGASAGNALTINNAAADLGNMVPNVSAPALSTTLTETCMGSSSGGAAAAGWGFSFGTTWRDTACVRRLDARQMSALNDIATAREMMCDSELVREAAARAGKPCVADGGKPWGTVATVAPIQEQAVASEPAAAATVTQQVRE